MSSGNVCVGWRTTRQNFNCPPVQLFPGSTKTICIWCYPLQPASRLRLWYWWHWYIALLQNCQEVRGTRSCKWTGFTAQQSLQYHHQSMDHRIFVQHKLVNDVYALIVLKEDNNNNNQASWFDFGRFGSVSTNFSSSWSICHNVNQCYYTIIHKVSTIQCLWHKNYSIF